MNAMLPAVRQVSAISYELSDAYTGHGKVTIGWTDAAGQRHELEFFRESARTIDTALRTADAISLEARHCLLLGFILGKTAG